MANGSTPLMDPTGAFRYLPEMFQGQQRGLGVGQTPLSGINFPTAPEAFDWAYGLPDIMQQRNLLGQMASPETMYQAMSPMLNQAFAQIGRSELPSSSFADRTIAGTVAPLWAQQQQNMLAGWQNLGRQLPTMMGAYWTPPQFMIGQGAVPESATTPTTPYALPPPPPPQAPRTSPPQATTIQGRRLQQSGYRR